MLVMLDRARNSDDTYVDASPPTLPEGGGVEGDLQLFANVFCSTKSMNSPSTLPPDGRGYAKIIGEDAQFLHLRCINTDENIHVEKRERAND